MWVGTQAAARLTVIGLGLIAAAVHGAGTRPATAPAPVAASVAYRPPATAAVVHAPRTPARVLRVASPLVVAHAIAHRPAAAAQQVRRPTTKPAPTAPRVRAPHKPAAAPTSFSSALQAAVARIPTYRAGAARWVVSSAYSFWGTADWYHDVDRKSVV